MTDPASGALVFPSTESELSFRLLVPECLVIPEDADTTASGSVVLGLEVSNHSGRSWKATSPTGSLLDVIVTDESGAEWSRQTRHLRLFAPPMRVDPGHGFTFPVRVFLPAQRATVSTYTLRVRIFPGGEETTERLRVESRAIVLGSA